MLDKPPTVEKFEELVAEFQKSTRSATSIYEHGGGHIGDADASEAGTDLITAYRQALARPEPDKQVMIEFDEDGHRHVVALNKEDGRLVLRKRPEPDKDLEGLLDAALEASRYLGRSQEHSLVDLSPELRLNEHLAKEKRQAVMDHVAGLSGTRLDRQMLETMNDQNLEWIECYAKLELIIKDLESQLATLKEKS